jgi:phenylpyruvate tautomerase PptA (4-oxalocrotonate tautomerase family)
MPMLDAYIPEGALSSQAEEQLLSQLTDLLLKHEGVKPTNERARSLAWVFLHRPQVFVGGARATAPHYRFVCQVPEGGYNDERRQAVIADMTDAVVQAEAGAYGDCVGRVWVFATEVPDGNWGVRGRVFRLPDIVEFVMGPKARALAEDHLAARRRADAKATLNAVPDRPSLARL